MAVGIIAFELCTGKYAFGKELESPAVQLLKGPARGEPTKASHVFGARCLKFSITTFKGNFFFPGFELETTTILRAGAGFETK